MRSPVSLSESVSVSVRGRGRDEDEEEEDTRLPVTDNDEKKREDKRVPWFWRLWCICWYCGLLFWWSGVAVASSWLRCLMDGCGCVVSGASEYELSDLSRGRRMRGKQESRGNGMRVEWRIVDVPVVGVVKLAPQERVQEPTVEHAPLSGVKSVGVGEASSWACEAQCHDCC